MRQLSWNEVSARRLERNFLAGPARPGIDLGVIARAMAGVHAQVMSAAEISLCLRTEAEDRAAVRNALWTTRTLIKTRGPRGTVHLLPAVDLPMWTAALSAIPPAQAPPWPEDVRFDPSQTAEVLAAIADAVRLSTLTLDELTDAIVARLGDWAGERTLDAFQDKWPRWRQVEAIAMSRGLLCYGPDRGRRATYTHPPTSTPVDAGLALTTLIRAFLYAYGPATPAQFARWLGAPAGWAERILNGRADLETVDFDGTPALVNAGDVDGGGSCAGNVRLLPHFDAYVIGAHPRTALFPEPAAARALRRGQAGPFPVVLVEGRVAGVWHRQRSGSRVLITVEMLRPPTKAHFKAIEAEAARIGDIVGATATAEFGEVRAGAHA